jgi:hypothetical protein
MGDWIALQDYAQAQGVSEQEVWAQVQAGQLRHRELGGAVYVFARDDRGSSALALAPPSVPMHYAERSMATLLQLHDELMAEKERCIDLHRRLMSREQAYAEIEYYARLLEAKLEGRYPDVPRPERLASVRPIRPDLNVAPTPAEPPRAASGSRPDGWRAW